MGGQANLLILLEHLPDSHADFRDELLTLHVNLSGLNPFFRLRD